MKRILGFAVVCLIIAVLIDYCTGSAAYGGTHGQLWRQICNGKEIDIVFLGNSHAYTSVDTKLLSEVYKMEVDTIAASSCSFKESYEAYKCLIKYTKPKYVVIEMYSILKDSFEDQQTKNRAYMYQNLDGIDNYYVKGIGVLKLFKFKNIPDGLMQIFRPEYMWSRWDTNRTTYEDTHGCVLRSSFAIGDVNLLQNEEKILSAYNENTMTTVPDYNKEALINFLNYAEDAGITVLLYKSPTLQQDYYVPYIKNIIDIVKEYDCVCDVVDSGIYFNEIGLSAGDFYDTNHLSRSGTEKFSEWYGKRLANLINKEWNTSNVFYVRGEEIHRDGNYVKYEMINYAEDCSYRFFAIVDGNVVETRELSGDSVYITEYDNEDEKVDIVCEMIKNDCVEDLEKQMIRYEFMSSNSSVLKVDY